MAIEVPDAAARAQALGPEESFIVQAPAGSGKTELLTQRFLGLLARVHDPEEVVAVTFTRKAAAEMRGRIVEALQAARRLDPPTTAHERKTWELGQAALERDAARGWRLLEQPARLRVRTIDSLCAALTRQMPLLAGFGAQPVIAERPESLHAEAARATVSLLESGEDWANDVETLLDHLANDLPGLERLLAAMLARRDQWLAPLHHGVDGSGRAAMETALAAIVTRSLEAARAAVPVSISDRLLELGRYAASRADADRAAIQSLSDLEDLPGTTIDHREQWLGFAELLLTGQDEWRVAMRRTEGFPAPSEKGITPDEKATRKCMKEAAQALLAELAAQPRLRESLAELRALPPTVLEDGQWHVLEALYRVLLLAAAQLRLAFARHGEVDFAEIAAGALTALGEPEAPTDLSLSLDYRLRHLLMDEFQDTSQVQYELLLRLTAGWEPGDGRTLFLVGDPMQSIYRFREAEVGLYLRARRHGIGDVALTPLTLSANFRSAPEVVTWVNDAFADLMPKEEAVASGAVPYATAFAARGDLSGTGVHCHPSRVDDPKREAQDVADRVAESLAEGADFSVAVLIRARRHAEPIVRALRERGIAYQAMELERLGDRPVVQDLRSLTRALLHPADRLVWLSVLRAPWCGLTLSDLTRLAGDERRDRQLPSLLHDESAFRELSPDGRKRLERLRDVLDAVLANRRRQPLDRYLEGAWLSLGGPATVGSESELANARAYFRLLRRLQRAGDLDNTDELDGELARLYAEPDTTGDARVQVMTIHRAKGLEFDTVILPGLGRATGRPERPLMRWMELPQETGEASVLLMAPIRRVGDTEDGLYRYLARLARRKDDLETVRLLYVAATRARRTLHLLGHVSGTPESEDPPKPASGSLLAFLWPAVEAVWRKPVGDAPVSSVVTAQTAPKLRRLPASWCLPAPPPAVESRGAPAQAVTGDEAVEFRWAGDLARHMGTVVHRFLQRIAAEGVESWDEARVRHDSPRIEALLAAMGVPEEQRPGATERVVEALRRTLTDPRGRWLLDADPARQPRSEYALSGRVDGRLINATIDRTFVDSDDIRWVVDYKTGSHAGGDPAAFLDREMQRYREQMTQYRALFRLLEDRPVWAAIYFPLLAGWRVYPE